MTNDVAEPFTNDQFVERARSQLTGVSVAWYADDKVAPVSEEIVKAVASAAQALAEAGLQVREERPPAISQGPRLWVELFSRPAAQQLREFYRGREDEARLQPDQRKTARPRAAIHSLALSAVPQ